MVSVINSQALFKSSNNYRLPSEGGDFLAVPELREENMKLSYQQLSPIFKQGWEKVIGARPL